VQPSGPTASLQQINDCQALDRCLTHAHPAWGGDPHQQMLLVEQSACSSLRSELLALAEVKHTSQCVLLVKSLFLEKQHHLSSHDCACCCPQDCWNRPIASAPGAWIEVMNRTDIDGRA
jgi:hypothetical protein